MVSIRITAKGFKNNKNLISDIITGHDEKLAELLHKLGEDVVDEARSNLQNNTNIDSGRLLSSIKILEEEPGKSVTVGSNIPYAEHIEYGRGPVRPKDPDGWLHWIDKDTGDDVFAKFAKATEPSPFMGPAVETETRRFNDVYITENEFFVRKRAIGLLDSELLD